MDPYASVSPAGLSSPQSFANSNGQQNVLTTRQSLNTQIPPSPSSSNPLNAMNNPRLNIPPHQLAMSHVQAQAQAQPSSQANQLQSPQSPGAQALAHERTSVLLDLNRELLEHLTKLQAQGQGPNTEANMSKMEGASQEWKDCMHRMQGNLQWLAACASPPARRPKNFPQGPAYMEPPNTLPVFVEMYARLKKVFPGWNGMPAAQLARATSAASPSTQTTPGQSGISQASTPSQAS